MEKATKMTENLFVPWEISSQLIELGMDIKMVTVNGKTGYLWQQIQDWLREKKNIWISFTYRDPVKAEEPGKADYMGVLAVPHKSIYTTTGSSADSYYELLETLIKRAINLLKIQNENKR